MSEIKAVTHEGKVYQIGKLYLFGDNKVDWEIGQLVKVHTRNNPIYLFENYCDCYKYIKEADFSYVGTITPSPIELVDGAVYTFGYGNRLNAVGVYDKCEKRFYHLRGMYFGFEGCTNIRLMTVESK
jgi:hypothetical protein